MAISVSIETLEDGEESGGPWFISNTEHCPHSFVEEMKANGGVFLGTGVFIPLGRVISLWFGEPEVETEDETEG